MSAINRDEFLQEQLDLIKAKKSDSSIEWQDIADFRADHIGELEHRDTVRKGSKLLQEYIDAGWSISPMAIECNSNQQIALKKERIKLQTEKLEYNKWLRENARDELVLEKIISAVGNLTPLNIPNKIETERSSKGYALVFGDEHYGAEFSLQNLIGETINEYSPEIFEQRMWMLLRRTIELIEKEDIKELNIFSMGDFADGILRVSQLMKLRYGVVDATVKYAEYISNWLNKLSGYVKINFQMTSGNHTELRQLGQPKGTFTQDNMDKVVRAFIKERLRNNPNFTMIENPTGYIYAQIEGNTILGIHGEVKNPANALREFSQIYGVPIQYLVMGHLHHSRTEEVGINCETINVPSVIGIDNYSLSLRKTSNAGAKLLVFSDTDGLVCDYRIKLN